MRVPRWIAPICSALFLLAGSGVCPAQDGSGPITSTPTGGSLRSPLADADLNVPPSLYARDYAAGYGGYSVEDFQPAQYPTDAMPWPGTSLYGEGFTQHYVDKNGLWQRETNRDKSYVFGIEYLMARSNAAGNAFVGNPNFPDTLSVSGPGLFEDNLRTDVIPKPKNEGVRGRWGFTNPDQSGLELTMWFLGKGNQTIAAFNDGDRTTIPDPDDPTMTILNVGPLRAFLPTGFGIWVDDRTDDGDRLRFNRGFSMTHYSRSLGTELQWMMTPVVKRGAFNVRPLVGGRFLQIREQFNLLAQDAGIFGLTYPTDPTQPTTETDPDLTTFVTPDIFNTTLQSKTESTLIGPEVGLRYELGGQKFKVWGKTSVGIMANQEKLEMTGDNWANPFRAGFFLPPDPTDPFPHRFIRTQEHNVVSPILEQTVFAELPIFSKLPILKRWRALDDAVFRVGYTYLLVGNIARPAHSIIYRADDPNFVYLNTTPEINPYRDKWSMGNWSFAIDWHY